MLSSLTTILAGDFNCVLNVNLDKRGGNVAWGKGGWTMQEQSAGVPTLWQSGPHARHVPQQTLLPQLQKPPLSSLPRLPTATFAPYHKQNPVWDVYPILRSIETSIGRSRRWEKATTPDSPSGVRSLQSQEPLNNPNIATQVLLKTKFKLVCNLYRRK